MAEHDPDWKLHYSRHLALPDKGLELRVRNRSADRLREVQLRGAQQDEQREAVPHRR